MKKGDLAVPRHAEEFPDLLYRGLLICEDGRFQRKMRLNLGCADDLRVGYLNVDRCLPDHWDQNKYACECIDLTMPWPWQDSSVDEIFARDVFEHLPDKIHTMNEAWRVLKPGGRLELMVPTTDGRGAFQDPTHVSFWTPNDLRYYQDTGFERQRLGKAYGIQARFRVVEDTHEKLPDVVWRLHAILEAVK